MRLDPLSPASRKMFVTLDEKGFAPEVGSNSEIRAVCPACWDSALDPDPSKIETYAKWLTINGQDPSVLVCTRECDAAEVLALIAPAQPSSPASLEGARGQLAATPLSQIEPRRVRWLYDRRIPLGELTLLGGPEGVGKSTFLAWLTAHVTRGTLDGALNGEPAGVLIAALEDDAATTLVPRMLAAGADLDLVAAVGDEDGLLSLPSQVASLELLIRDGLNGVPVRLLIVDPIKATTGGMDTDRERGVRELLGKLVAVAQTHGVTMIFSSHFKKSAGSEDFAAWKMSGSPAWTQVPRSVIYFGMDPDAEEGGPERILAHAKCNVGRTMPTLTATITAATITTSDRSVIETSVMQIGGESSVLASEMSRPPEAGGKVGACAEWLQSYLGDGEPQDSRTVKAAAETEGFIGNTLTRAAKKIGVRIEREGSGASHCSYWSLPGTSGESGASQAPTNGTHATDATHATPSTDDGPVDGCRCASPRPAPTSHGTLACVACGQTTTWSGAAA